MTPAASGERFGVWRVTKFYVPLLLQAFSQSLTYPLVAGIVTHGPLGVNALTAFSQGQMIMFMVGALGCGLVTTGMVFARTRGGYRSFRRLNATLMAVLLAAQCLPAVPPFSHYVFVAFFGLPPELAEVARNVLVAGVAMNGAFFLRNVPLVVLFNRLQGGKAIAATLARIAFTLACAREFPRFGLVGPYWGLVALTLGCFIETISTWLFARRYVRELPDSPPPAAASFFGQLNFTLPLSLGGFLLTASPLLVAAFVARSASGQDMLAIHYVTIGVANPVAYASLRLQPVTVQFPPEGERDRRLLAYALVSGLVLGLLPLAFSTESFGNWYFGTYQNLGAQLVPTARLAIALYAFVCVIQAWRARAEGLAAVRQRPTAVMAGQIAYTLTLAAVLAALLPLGVPGWAMAVSAILAAPAACAITVTLALREDARA